MTMMLSPGPPIPLLTCCSWQLCSCRCRCPRRCSSSRCSLLAWRSPPRFQFGTCYREQGCPRAEGLVGGWSAAAWRATEGCCGRWRRRCPSTPPPLSPPSSPGTHSTHGEKWSDLHRFNWVIHVIQKWVLYSLQIKLLLKGLSNVTYLGSDLML